MVSSPLVTAGREHRWEDMGDETGNQETPTTKSILKSFLTKNLLLKIMPPAPHAFVFFLVHLEVTPKILHEKYV